MKKIISYMGLFILLLSSASAQILHPVSWSYAAKRTGKNQAVLLLKASIEDGWHIYSAYQADGGPVKTSFEFTPVKDYDLIGKIEEPVPVSKFEEAFNMKVSFFEKTVVFQQKVRLDATHPVIKGKLNFMVCNNQKCLSPETVEFTVPVK
jgi:hypothetical protein